MLHLKWRLYRLLPGEPCFAADFIYFWLRSTAANSYAESVYGG